MRTGNGPAPTSLVPDALVHADTGTKLVLATTHLVAAAIVIPAVAAKLHD